MALIWCEGSDARQVLSQITHSLLPSLLSSSISPTTLSSCRATQPALLPPTKLQNLISMNRTCLLDATWLLIFTDLICLSFPQLQPGQAPHAGGLHVCTTRISSSTQPKSNLAHSVPESQSPQQTQSINPRERNTGQRPARQPSELHTTYRDDREA